MVDFMPISKWLMSNYPAPLFGNQDPSTIVCIDGTDVSQAYWDIWKHVCGTSLTEISICPPSNCVVLEFSRVPESIRTNTSTYNPSKITRHYAILIDFIKVGTNDHLPALASPIGGISGDGDSSREILKSVRSECDGDGWLVRQTFLSYDFPELIIGGVRYSFLSKGGSFKEPKVLYEHVNPKDSDYEASGQLALGAHYGCFFNSANYVLAFLSCKNVSTREVRLPLTRPERRRGMKPFRYHVLTISSPAANPRKNGEAKAEDVTALHLRRGHFKTYTQERPLLGRHFGTFYFSQHAVGQFASGVVRKDYQAVQ